MSKSVTIEGSITPAVGVLARGERRTVALTSYIEDLVAKGYIIIVETIDHDKGSRGQ